MGKIREGELLRVKYGFRVTKFPGFPSINDGFHYVDRDAVVLSVSDEFVYMHRMMGGRDLEEPYVKILASDQNVYFANPRCLDRVTQPESADKISEKEIS